MRQKIRITTDFDTPTGFIVTLELIQTHFVKYTLEWFDKEVVPDPSRKVLAEGTVKWDGCSNTTFKNTHHFCSADGFILLNKAFETIWKKSKEMLDNANSFSSDLGPWDISCIIIKTLEE